jgi:predicted CXXCH cytochrome family protein
MPIHLRPISLSFLLTFALMVGCTPESGAHIPSPLDATASGTDFTSLMETSAGDTTASVSTQANPCFESGCHAELKTNEGPYKHQPFVDNRCLDCHIAFHNPGTQRLYTQSDIDLCYGCHSQNDLGNSHPVGEGVIDPKTMQMMTCTSTCHLSHTAPYEYLLALRPGGELCLACHKDFINP